MHEARPIFETVHGSRAYGLARAGSDTDRKGVVVGPRRWYLGVRPGPEQLELSPDHVRYDTKHAMHLVRLQRMGLEILRGDGVRVTRPDRDELWAIRDGHWSYETLLAHAEAQGAAMRRLEAESPLPADVDEEALDALAEELIVMTLEPEA